MCYGNPIHLSVNPQSNQWVHEPVNQSISQKMWPTSDHFKRDTTANSASIHISIIVKPVSFNHSIMNHLECRQSGNIHIFIQHFKQSLSFLTSASWATHRSVDGLEIFSFS